MWPYTVPYNHHHYNNLIALHSGVGCTKIPQDCNASGGGGRGLLGVLFLRSLILWEDHSGTMVCVLNCTSSSLGLSQWLGSLHCVLGQDALVSLTEYPPPPSAG